MKGKTNQRINNPKVSLTRKIYCTLILKTMRNTVKSFGLVILITLVCHLFCTGQEQIKKERALKNTIRFNFTGPFLFGPKYLVFGYECVIKNNQTISVSIGQFSLPKFGSIFSDTLQIQKGFKDIGINFSLDYRFYLKKENKYAAPRGVYLGPYYSLNHLKRQNKWTLNTDTFDGEVNTDLILNIHTVGVELGYQFVLWKRLAIDLVLLGPGVGFYNIKTNLNTTLSPNDEALFFQKLNDLLAKKFPGYDLVIDTGEFQTKGSFKTTTLGFRYMINIGFRF
jgi:hypothetical protein